MHCIMSYLLHLGLASSSGAVFPHIFNRKVESDQCLPQYYFYAVELSYQEGVDRWRGMRGSCMDYLYDIKP